MLIFLGLKCYAVLLHVDLDSVTKQVRSGVIVLAQTVAKAKLFSLRVNRSVDG